MMKRKTGSSVPSRKRTQDAQVQRGFLTQASGRSSRGAEGRPQKKGALPHPRVGRTRGLPSSVHGTPCADPDLGGGRGGALLRPWGSQDCKSGPGQLSSPRELTSAPPAGQLGGGGGGGTAGPPPDPPTAAPPRGRARGRSLRTPSRVERAR